MSEKTKKEELLESLDLLLREFKPTVKNINDVKPYEINFLEESKTPSSGVTIFTHAFSEVSIREAQLRLGQALACMWKEQLSQEDWKQLLKGNLEVLNSYRNNENGFGNTALAYFFKLYPDEYVKANVGKANIAFDLNSIHSHVIIPFLLHPDNRHSLAVHQGLGAKDCILSQDSIKYASDPKPRPKSMTPQKLTAPHVDIYANEIQRVQIMAILDRGRTKLFFVPGTSNARVKDLMCQILDDPNLYQNKGYIAIQDADLLAVLQKHAVATGSGCMVGWEESIVHFEATGKEKPDEGDGLYRVQSFKAIPNNVRFRMAIGTHYPKGLSREERVQLGLHSKHGIIPAVYPCAQNRGTAVDLGVVGKKRTRSKGRKMKEEERKRARTLASMKCDVSESVFETLVPDPMERHLYGVHQPIDVLGFSEEDTACLQQLWS